MVKNGRTMSQAILDGNAFELNGPNGFSYFPPAAESPEEVIKGIMRIWALSSRKKNMIGNYTIDRIIGGSIGARFVERDSFWKFDGESFMRRYICETCERDGIVEAIDGVMICQSCKYANKTAVEIK